MPRPILPAHEKRRHDVEVAFNDAEYELLLIRAKDAGKSIARFVREAALSDERIQIITRRDQTAAHRVRSVSESFRKLYNFRVKLIETGSPRISAAQTNPNCAPLDLTSDEVRLWRETSEELNRLNAELLDYADD